MLYVKPLKLWASLKPHGHQSGFEGVMEGDICLERLYHFPLNWFTEHWLAATTGLCFPVPGEAGSCAVS